MRFQETCNFFFSCTVYVNCHYFSFTYAGYAKLGSGGVGKNPAAAKSAGTKTHETNTGIMYW